MWVYSKQKEQLVTGPTDRQRQRKEGGAYMHRFVYVCVAGLFCVAAFDSYFFCLLYSICSFPYTKHNTWAWLHVYWFKLALFIYLCIYLCVCTCIYLHHHHHHYFLYTLHICTHL